MSAKEVQERTGDEETDDILQEMADEGIELPAFAGDTAEVEDTSKEKVDDQELDESAEETSEEEGEAEDGEKKSKTDDESEEDDDEADDDQGEDDGDDEGEEGEEGDGKKKGKRLGLVQKYRNVKNQLREANAAIETLKAAKSQEEFDKELADFAKKMHWELEPAKQFMELVARRAGVPKEVMDEIQASRKERSDREYWGKQRKSFERDFSGNVAPVLENLGKSKAEIAAIRETLYSNEDSEFWAWDKKNKPKTLVQLALGAVRASGSRSSSERSGNRVTRTPRGKDVSDMSAEDLNEMSDEEFDKWSDSLGQGQRSTIHRS
jgi:hypothetical protein